MELNMKKKLAVYIIMGIAAILVVAGGYWGYLFASTPSHMRNPQFEHYHFRTQLIVGGNPVDFSADEFQVPNEKGSCSIELGGHPIDFHDNIDQMTHIHWDGVTGGQFLKYYGWNYIGGSDDSMGRRFDQGMMNMPHVPIYGNLLPDVPEGSNFYVYIGDEAGYEQKDWNDFLNQNLEDFFGKQSNLKQNEQASNFRLDSWLFKGATAHGGIDDDHDEEELIRLSNLIGNVVIFVQDSEPTDAQIRERFNDLVPLQDSTCG
jgi:hypothetical protein